MNHLKIAVLLPCYNEEDAIAQTIIAFRNELPQSDIYVYDNNSTDKTREVAKKNGAIVKSEFRRGKGNVVKRMFADVDADVYILCDGDDTYEAAAVARMVDKMLDEDLDMVVGKRVENTDEKQAAYRRGHRLGNKLFNKFVAFFFGETFTDIFSGYRVFSRRFVKSFPAVAGGFDIEAEIVIHCLDLKLPAAEIEAAYKERPTGSVSKLSTYKDGIKILKRIILLMKDYKPLLFFSGIAFVLLILGVGMSAPVLATYLKTGLVPRFPTLLTTIGLLIISFMSFVCGLILDNTAKARRELKYLHYLSFPKPREGHIPTAKGFSKRRRGASRRNVYGIREDGERRWQQSRKFIREGYN